MNPDFTTAQNNGQEPMPGGMVIGQVRPVRPGLTVGEGALVLGSFLLATLIIVLGERTVYHYGKHISLLALWCGEWITPLHRWIVGGLAILPISLAYRRCALRNRQAGAMGKSGRSLKTHLSHFTRSVLVLGILRLGGTYGLLSAAFNFVREPEHSFLSHCLDFWPYAFGFGISLGLFIWISNPLEPEATAA